MGVSLHLITNGSSKVSLYRRIWSIELALGLTAHRWNADQPAATLNIRKSMAPDVFFLHPELRFFGSLWTPCQTVGNTKNVKDLMFKLMGFNSTGDETLFRLYIYIYIYIGPVSLATTFSILIFFSTRFQNMDSGTKLTAKDATDANHRFGVSAT